MATAVETIECWKCQSGAMDPSGFCRQCGSDMFYPPRPPTEADLRREPKGVPCRADGEKLTRRKRSGVVRYQPNG